MIEFMLAFCIAVAALNVTVDTASAAYDYVEPKVSEGVGYIKNKISPAEQE